LFAVTAAVAAQGEVRYSLVCIPVFAAISPMLTSSFTFSNTSAQRRQYKIVTEGQSGSTAMTVERVRKLISIGFEWSTTNPKHVSWETRYEELKYFYVSAFYSW
jgi:hypothetical protein